MLSTDSCIVAIDIAIAMSTLAAASLEGTLEQMLEVKPAAEAGSAPRRD